MRLAFSKLGNWLQVGANIGILAGLGMVWLQIQQASELLHLQLLHDQTQSYIATQWSAAGEQFADVWEKHLKEPENLSLSDMRVLEASYWGPLKRWQMTYSLYEQGLVESSEWMRVIDQDVTFLFGSAYGKAYWKVISSGKIPLPDELVSYIDVKLAEEPEASPERFYSTIQRRLAEERD